MKNILLIFWNDSKRIFSNVVAIVIIMGLSIIPALYAWFNILSNWDPYGAESTGRMEIAIFSEDDGYSMSGISLNVGESVVEALHANDTIGWQFVDSREEALDGVKSGQYYAALILPEDFTEHLVSFTSKDPTPGVIEYYENSKKNAIATKITSKVEKTVQTQVATSFVEKIAQVSWVLGEALGEGAEETDVFGTTVGTIDEIVGDLTLISSALEGLEQVGSTAGNLSEAGRGLINGQESLIESNTQLIDILRDDIINLENQAITKIEDTPIVVPSIDIPSDIQISPENLPIDENKIAEQARDALEYAKVTTNALSGNFTKVNDAMKAYKKVLDDGGSQLQATRTYIDELIATLSSMSVELKSISENGIYNSMQEMMDKDPDRMASFLAAPVDLQTESIYPIAPYGSAMAPFYTVLAIWVGALILVALIHVKVEDEPDIPNAKPWQKYFGRYLTFFCIGQAQAVITLLGDLFFVGIQCLYPVRFVLAGMVISFVFTFFMYSLTVALGNVGEAIAVVIMVIQVAGSGGTFPVEVLPEVYQRIVTFLPFPYGMDALRECIGGLYADTYEYSLLKLLSYILISLFIGLVVAIPFRGLNKRIEKSKQRSGLMI